MLEELPPGATVIYRASHGRRTWCCAAELDWLAEARDADVWYVIGSRDDPGPRQLLSPGGLRQLVPDVPHRDVYLCGPPGLIDLAQRAVRKAGVSRQQIHVAGFEL